MNGIVQFRLCTLSHKELIDRVDHATDKIFKTHEIPERHIPARPDEDYDLIVGELIYRFDDAIELLKKASAEIRDICDAMNVGNADLIKDLEAFIHKYEPSKICYKTNEPCKFDCEGLCKESC